MPTEIEGLQEGQMEKLRVATDLPPHKLDNIYTSTRVGVQRQAPGVMHGLEGQEPMEALAFKDGRFSWIDVKPKGGIPMRITHMLGADLSKTPCDCARGKNGVAGLGGLDCGCRFGGLEETQAKLKGEVPVVELKVQFMGSALSPDAVQSEMQRFAASCGAKLARSRRAKVNKYVIWTWKAIPGDRWQAHIGNRPFKGVKGPIVSLGQSGQPPTIHQTNKLPGQIQSYTFRLVPPNGSTSTIAPKLPLLQRALERAGAISIVCKTRILSMPRRAAESLAELDGLVSKKTAPWIGAGLAAYLLYRYYKPQPRW